jgi:hypothetical protein
MTRFVSCDGGFINLSHVVRARKHRAQHGGFAYTFEDAGGDILGRQAFGEGDLEECTAPVVPATGVEAVIMTPHAPELDGRPDSVYTERVLVAAWRVTHNGPVPVFVDEPASDALWFIIQPDGKLAAPGEATFDTVAEAEDAVLAWAQAGRVEAPAS